MEGEPVKKYEAKEKILYPETAAEILKRAEEDQKMRFGIEDGGSWDASIDERNTEYMKNLIQKIGYPHNFQSWKRSITYGMAIDSACRP